MAIGRDQLHENEWQPAGEYDLVTQFKTLVRTTYFHVTFQMQVSHQIISYTLCDLWKANKEVMQGQLRVDPHSYLRNVLGKQQDVRGLHVVDGGYMLNVVRCLAVNVTLRETTLCASDIPVYFGDKEIFADPLTFILKPNSTMSVCSQVRGDLLKLQFYLNMWQFWLAMQ